MTPVAFNLEVNGRQNSAERPICGHGEGGATWDGRAWETVCVCVCTADDHSSIKSLFLNR